MLPEARELILKRTVEGASAQTIAAEIGYSSRVVFRARRAQMMSEERPSHPVRRGRPAPAERIAEIGRMVSDGASHAEIARTLHCDPRTVSRHYPGTAWTKEQSGAHGALIRRYQERSTAR